MAGTVVGGMKAAAHRLGMAPTAYAERLLAGERWCNVHKAWEPVAEFGADRTGPDGIASACRTGKNARARRLYVPHPPQHHGPLPDPPRDGDKRQARRRINVEVRTGRRPHPNTLPCTDCHHIWAPGERRHEYDHAKGYGAAFHLYVEPVCTRCQSKRAWARGELTREAMQRGQKARAQKTRLGVREYPSNGPR